MVISLLRLLAVGLAIVVQTTAAQRTTVSLPNGATITGSVEARPAGNNVRAFRGIPYAEAPVGTKRWKPSTLKPVTGALNALNYGSTCLGVSTASGSTEDCLFLNIFAPANANTSSKFPVMVWIHGGALLNGASNSYEGHAIVKASGQKVVVVTINYRLGIFGFFSSKEILAEGNGANFGLRDQEVAFQWVKQYIQYFNGDPNSVTAFGGSAGGWSIGAHLVSRDGNQKLFERAILQSGAYATVHDTPPPSVQQQKAVTVANGVGCGNSPNVMSCLRSANANQLTSITGSNWRGFPWMPVVDGVFLKDVPIRLLRARKFSRVPTIVGHNTDEGWMFTSWVTQQSQLDSFLRSQFSMLTESEYAQIKSMYPVGSFQSLHHCTSEIYGDAIFTCPGQQLSESFAGNTYRYRFNFPKYDSGYQVTNHGVDAIYVFNQVGSISDNDQQGKQVANYFQQFWTTFAATSSPNPQNTVAWPLFTSATKQEVVIQPSLAVETMDSYHGGHATRCAFWLSVEQRIANQVAFA